MKRKIAAFDIDGTLFRSSLLSELVDTMIAEEIIPATARNQYLHYEMGWKDRKKTYPEYINAVVETFMEHIKGVHFDDFDRAARIVGGSYSNRVYRFTRDLIEELKKDNYYVVAISQSPKRVLDVFCKGYGFDKVYGRIYEIGPSDRFTGVVTDEHLIADKSTILRRIAEKEDVTLEGSIGVGDTADDIPLLESVEHPICFNPSSVLYRHARINKWRVVVERKDVIYEIQ